MSVLDQELYYAVVFNNVAKVEGLLERDASVNYKGYNGDTPLHYAATKGNVEIAELLIRNKADVNAPDNLGDTPLHDAATKGNVEIAELLIRNKADVNAPDNLGVTPLHKAAKVGYDQMAELLIRNKADVNAPDNAGVTPLHKAATERYVEIAKLLIRNKADVNAPDHVGDTSLHRGINAYYYQGNMVMMVESLIRLGANVSVSNNKGVTPLHEAAKMGYVEIAELLIKNKADVNAPDNVGVTPLHEAANMGYVEIAELLIKNKADVNAPDNVGDTPLHKAVDFCSIQKEATVERLIRLGANVSALNKKGHTSQDLLEEKCRNSKWYKKDKQGDSVLHQAASNGPFTVVQTLVSLGTNFSALNVKGKSPLQLLEKRCKELWWYREIAKDSSPFHEAVRYGKQDIVKTLLCLGADSSSKNDLGETPYDIAEYQYEENKDNFNAKHYKTIVDYLTKKTEELQKTRDNLGMPRKKHTACNSDASELPNIMQSDRTNENDVQLPWLVDAGDFQRMLSHGEYLSYDNRLSLGGPCRAGKSTLASVLIGEDIPLKWDSTDGLVIFFGRNGIDIEKKKMVPLEAGERGHEVLAKILRGEPDVGKMFEEEYRNTRANLPVQADKKTTVSQKQDKQMGSETVKYEIDQFVTNTCNTDVTMNKYVMERLNTVNETKGVSTTTTTTNIQTIEYKKLQLKSDIIEEVRNGRYQIKIAPSDLIDFGGQKSYDMTHQLFIQHGGSFLLMFDGRFGLHEQLQGYPVGNTAASILIHWVNSILTYTEDTDDIMPMIMFAATHRDQIKCDTVKLREQLNIDIKQMFSGHEQKHHIHLETIYFINGLDRNDVEIQHMTEQVVKFAMQQSSWGQRRPMQWVPLELQISKMRMKNINIITKENLQCINMQNEDLELKEDQLNDFLIVQHSLGKLMYYNLPGLDKYIIIHPPALVNILRSFVTDEKFFPANHNLKYILQKLTTTGKIYKTDLLLLWQQDDVHQFMPNAAMQEFVVQLLIHLDILVVPKVFAEKHDNTDLYIVPCMLKTNKPPSFNLLDTQGETTICLKYSLKRHSIPTSLAYKLIGAAINVWPLKTEGTKSCLYHMAAVLNVGEDSELRICLEGNQVIVYMINQQSLLSISPDVAASVQECLTRNLESSLLFYYNSFGRTMNPTRVSELYHMEIGIPCGSGNCFISSLEVTKINKWTCKNGKEHNTKYVRYWVFDKSQKACNVGCAGLTDIELQTQPSDKHLVRLGSQIEYSIFREFFLNLGMELEKWHSTESTYASHCSEGIRSMALKQWKTFHLSKLKNPTLKDLSDALKKVKLDSHLVCQIFRENMDLVEYADLDLQADPNDQHLKELSNQIGNCPLQLGIELGLSFTEVEHSLFRFPKDLPGLVEDILKKWKAKSKVKTIFSLMMALQRVDAGGVEYLRDIAKPSDLN